MNSLKHLRKERAIRFPPPNELCCKIFCSSEREEGTKSKTTSMPTWEEGMARIHRCLRMLGWLLHTPQVLSWSVSSHASLLCCLSIEAYPALSLARDRNILKLNPSHSDLPKVLLVEDSAPDPPLLNGHTNLTYPQKKGKILHTFGSLSSTDK